jgi:hypothetical protein
MDKEQNVDMSQVSDGYHTFAELYEHRMALTAAFLEALRYSRLGRSWRSKAHHPDDQEIPSGYFIVGVELGRFEQITYHYEMKHWDLFDMCEDKQHAPKWDGHTSNDVVKRLLHWVQS